MGAKNSVSTYEVVVSPEVAEQVRAELLNKRVVQRNRSKQSQDHGSRNFSQDSVSRQDIGESGHLNSLATVVSPSVEWINQQVVNDEAIITQSLSQAQNRNFAYQVSLDNDDKILLTQKADRLITHMKLDRQKVFKKLGSTFVRAQVGPDFDLAQTCGTQKGLTATLFTHSRQLSHLNQFEFKSHSLSFPVLNYGYTDLVIDLIPFTKLTSLLNHVILSDLFDFTHKISEVITFESGESLIGHIVIREKHDTDLQSLMDSLVALRNNRIHIPLFFLMEMVAILKKLKEHGLILQKYKPSNFLLTSSHHLLIDDLTFLSPNSGQLDYCNSLYCSDELESLLISNVKGKNLDAVIQRWLSSQEKLEENELISVVCIFDQEFNLEKQEFNSKYFTFFEEIMRNLNSNLLQSTETWLQSDTIEEDNNLIAHLLTQLKPSSCNCLLLIKAITYLRKSQNKMRLLTYLTNLSTYCIEYSDFDECLLAAYEGLQVLSEIKGEGLHEIEAKLTFNVVVARQSLDHSVDNEIDKVMMSQLNDVNFWTFQVIKLRHYFMTEQFDQLINYEKSNSLARKCKNPVKQSIILNLVAKSFFHLQRPHDALTILSSIMGTPDIITKACLKKCFILSTLNNHDKVIQDLKAHLKKYKHLLSYKQLFQVYSMIAASLRETKQRLEGLKMQDKAIRYADQFYTRMSPQVIQAFCTLGHLYYESYKLLDTKDILKKIIDLERESISKGLSPITAQIRSDLDTLQVRYLLSTKQPKKADLIAQTMEADKMTQQVNICFHQVKNHDGIFHLYARKEYTKIVEMYHEESDSHTFWEVFCLAKALLHVGILESADMKVMVLEKVYMDKQSQDVVKEQLMLMYLRIKLDIKLGKLTTITELNDRFKRGRTLISSVSNSVQLLLDFLTLNKARALFSLKLYVESLDTAQNLGHHSVNIHIKTKSALLQARIISSHMNERQRAVDLAEQFLAAYKGRMTEYHENRLMLFVQKQRHQARLFSGAADIGKPVYVSFCALLGADAFLTLKCLYCLGVSYRNKGDLQTSQESLEKVAELSFGRFRYLYAKASYELGHVSSLNKDFDQAEVWYNRCQEACVNHKNDSLKENNRWIEAMMGLAYAHRMRNDCNQALEYALMADEGFRSVPGKDKEVRKAKSIEKRLIALIGRMSYINSDYEVALQQYQRLEQILARGSGSHRDLRLMWSSKVNQASILFAVKDFEGARDQTLEAFRLVERDLTAISASELAKGYENLGKCYENLGDVQEMLLAYDRMVELEVVVRDGSLIDSPNRKVGIGLTMFEDEASISLLGREMYDSFC